MKTKEGKNTLNNYLIWQVSHEQIDTTSNLFQIIKNFDMALSLKYREVDQVLQKVLHGTEVHEERWLPFVKLSNMNYFDQTLTLI